MSTFLVRPSNSEKEAFRVKLTAASLLGLKLKSGDLCHLKLSNEGKDDDEGDILPKSAIAWEVSGTGMKDNVVQTSKMLQELYGFKLGDKISISRAGVPLGSAEVVRLSSKTSLDILDDQQNRFWEHYAKLTLGSLHECLAIGQILSFKVGVVIQNFEVLDIGIPETSIGKITEGTLFRIDDKISTNATVNFEPQSLGGLQSQIIEVQKLITRLLSPKIPLRYHPVQGLLVYGTKGVGKTCFIEELSASGWTSIIRWTAGAKISPSNQPCLIIVDQLDLPSSQNATRSSVRELDRLFSSIRGKPCFVVGETKHPNDVDSYLRSEGKFGYEIEIPIPTALQRKEILNTLKGNDLVPGTDIIENIASRTHGYVGADLYALLRRILELASERSAENPVHTVNGTSSEPDEKEWNVNLNDVEQALTQIRPSALQEIFLETPNVHWSDIGGQHEIKRQLQNAVERPLKFADQMKKLALKPKKGVLLYGPPGCSKTLLVRALATEAGLNFLAVKGAELISMYVGESERATREVFRKARAASPSIIFFDEIDAIATRGRAGNDLNVLTTLLNEMDGFEELKNVLVVAATNKPENIDSALTRPGRFDNVVYIGPPDFEARKEIFQKQFEKSSYQTRKSIEEDSHSFADVTEGFSGAEVVAICQTAAEFALDNDRDYYDASDLLRAVNETPKGITLAMLEQFKAWNAARM